MARDPSLGALARMPLFLLVAGIASVSMYVPAAFALILDNHAPSRSFFYAGTLGLIFVTMIGISIGARKPRYGALGQLLSLLGIFTLLPLYLAVPFHDALGNTRFLNAYFDMVSAITTTGANLFPDPARLPPTLHLWRAQVGWMGGFLMWVAASAILAPLSLGGFEVTARAEPGRMETANAQMVRADPRRRLIAISRKLAPIYAGLTVVLWIALLVAGDTPFVAICHAMSIMATSGISPVGGIQNGGSGVPGEMLMLLFMLFALSRLTFSSDTAASGYGRLDRDPEFRIGVLLVIGVPLVLFVRHWLGAYEFDGQENPGEAVRAFWGGMFTVMSFLTTTGFVSADWQAAQVWSGLKTPGLILMGLALIGGGVATTAGGVKLLRVFALYLNGLREMQRLVHPSSVSGEGAGNRRIQSGGAFIAWIFFMLFAISLAAVAMLLASVGVSFENAMLLSISALSTTGPLIEVAAETPIRLIELAPEAKLIFCAAMVLGRLETLAIIALVTTDLWRN